MTKLDRLQDEAQRLVADVAHGNMASTAYDTAWVARLREPDGSRSFPAAINWLLERQHDDGSWGGPIAMPHDRVISTLAALPALADYPERIDAGCAAIRHWLPLVADHPAETVAFELLAPALLADCRRLCFDLPYGDFAFVESLRAEKLARIPAEFVYSPASPLAFSLEHRGDDLDVTRLPAAHGANGSFGNSPSATAYVLLRQPDSAARAYLDVVSERSRDGGFCNVQPFDVFEHAWVLFNLQIGGLAEGADRLVDFLADRWTDAGVGWNSAGILPDCDDTAVAIKVLRAAGRQVPGDALRRFRTADHFVCYHGERTTCATANIHALDALNACPELADRQELRNVALGYLQRTRQNGYWFDKWHASPYYPVSHALIALGADPESAPSVAWLRNQQRADGGWGLAGSTSEETGYAILGLIAAGEPKQSSRIQRGAQFLWDRINDLDYPPLWIGKGLYTPTYVVRSAVLAALALSEH